MVYVINESTNINLDKIIDECDNFLQNAVYEFEYSVLMYKYNYLVENGTVVSEGVSNLKIVQFLKDLAKKFVDKIKEIFNSIKSKFNSIKNKIKDNKKKKHLDDCIKDSENNANFAINDINNIAKEGTEESGKKMKDRFNIFKNKETSKVKEEEKSYESEYHELLTGSDIVASFKNKLGGDVKLILIYPPEVDDDKILKPFKVSKSDTNMVFAILWNDKTETVLKKSKILFSNIETNLQAHLIENNGFMVVTE